MGNLLGNDSATAPPPTPQPSPVLNALKALGGGVLAVPKGIGQGIGDLMVGPGGHDLPLDQKIARIVQTLALGENMGAQMLKLENWEGADALYRSAPDRQDYRDIVDSAVAQGSDPEVALKRYFGRNAVPPFSSIPQAPQTFATWGGRETVQDRPDWGGPTLEERQDRTQEQRALESLERLERTGNVLGHEMTVAVDRKTGRPIPTLSTREKPYFNARDIDHEVLRAAGLRTTPPVQFPDGSIGVQIERNPAVDAGATAEAAALGRLRAKVTPLGGGGIPGTAPAATSGSGGIPGTGPAPVAAPMPGQIETPELPAFTPDMTGEDVELAGLVAKKNIELQYERIRSQQAAALKGRTLGADGYNRLNAIATGRAFVEAFEDYAINGTMKDPDVTLQTEGRFPSTLPTARLRGKDVPAERVRQSTLYQENWDRDPFLRNYRGYQGLAKPLLTRAIGGDVGNLNIQEQQAIEGLMQAIAVPEVRDTVRQLRNILLTRERELLRGKIEAPGTAPAAPAVSPTRQKLLERFPPRR